MIRNHAEAVVEQANVNDLVNMIGFNLRMTELSAAVGISQMNNLEHHVSERTNFAQKLSNSLETLAGIEVPKVRQIAHTHFITGSQSMMPPLWEFQENFSSEP